MNLIVITIISRIIKYEIQILFKLIQKKNKKEERL